MNLCGIHRRPLNSTLIALTVFAVMAVLSFIGCGAGNSTYSPVAKTGTTPPTPGFTVAVNPASVSVSQGNVASYNVVITETGGFNSPITLSATGLPAGATASFSALTATATGATATMSVPTSFTAQEDSAILANQSKSARPTSVSESGKPATRAGGGLSYVAVGSYSNITVTAVGGGITQTSNGVTLVVTAAQDFAITLAPASTGSNIVSPGGTAKFIVTASTTSGFSSPVTLSLGSLPVFPQNQGLTATFGSPTITPTAAGATTTLSISTSTNEGAFTNPAAYALTVTGTAGTLVHTASATFDVGIFSLSVTEATSGSGNVVPGGTAHYIVTLTSVNNFAPVVTLTQPALPAGCTATFGSPTIIPGPGPNGTSTTLTITTAGPSSATPTAPQNLNVNVGAGGGGWNTAGSAQLSVQDYTITVTPTSGSTSTGNNIQFTVTATSLNGYSLPVTLVSAGTPVTGTTTIFGLPTLTPSAAGATTTVTITSNSATTPTGTFPFVIQGQGAGIGTASPDDHSANYSLTFSPG